MSVTGAGICTCTRGLKNLNVFLQSLGRPTFYDKRNQNINLHFVFYCG